MSKKRPMDSLSTHSSTPTPTKSRSTSILLLQHPDEPPEGITQEDSFTKILATGIVDQKHWFSLITTIHESQGSASITIFSVNSTARQWAGLPPIRPLCPSFLCLVDDIQAYYYHFWSTEHETFSSIGTTFQQPPFFHTLLIFKCWSPEWNISLYLQWCHSFTSWPSLAGQVTLKLSQHS